MLTATHMTLLGAFGAGLSFVLAGLPMGTPWYVKTFLGSVNAFLVFYLGQTNKGTIKEPEPSIIITPQDSKKA